MPADSMVSANQILHAQRHLERRGSTRVMQELESAEPDLAEHMIEGLTAIYHRLSRHCDRPDQVRATYRLTRRLLLVSVTALRRGHYELWRERAEGTPLAGLNDNNDDDDADGVSDDAGQRCGDDPPDELT